MCAKLRYNTSLDAPLHNSLSLHAIVSDGISAEDTYLGTYTPDPLDQQDKRTLILSKLDSLRLVEQAAVLVVFGLQDLISDDMAQQELDDPIVISRALGLQDPQSLENYVRSGILPKISE